MKKNKKTFIKNLIISSLILTPIVSVVAACVNNKEQIKADEKNETQNDANKYEIASINFLNISDSSVEINIKFNKEINTNESFNLIIKDIANQEILINNSVINNKNIVFKATNLESDLRYFVDHLLVNNQKIKIPSNLKVDFQTNAKSKEVDQKEPQIITINNINFENIEANNADLILESKNELSINDLSITFNNEIKPKFIKKVKSKYYFKLKNLLPNTQYQITNITVKDKVVVYNDKITKSFKTPLVLVQKVNNLFFKNIEQNSATIVIGFNLKTNPSDVISLEVNNQLNYQSTRFENNEFIFNLSNLSPNQQYQITSIKINQKPIDYSQIINTSFRTPNKVIKKQVSVNLDDTTYNSSKAVLDISGFEQINKLLIELDNKQTFSNYQIKNNKYEVVLNDLNHNQQYSIKRIFVNDEEVAITSNSKLVFRTLIKPINIQNIQFYNTTNQSTQLVLNLNQEIVNKNIEIRLNDKLISFNNQNSNNQNLILLLDNLQANTNYVINRIKIDEQIIDLNQLNNKSFVTKPNDPPKQDNFVVQSIENLQSTNNLIKLRILFSQFELANSNSKDFEIILNNETPTRFNNYVDGNNYVDVIINNLQENQEYRVTSLKINNKSISLNNQYAFRTLSSQEINPNNSDFKPTENENEINVRSPYFENEENITLSSNYSDESIKNNDSWVNYFSYLESNQNNDVINEELQIQSTLSIISNDFEGNNLVIKIDTRTLNSKENLQLKINKQNTQTLISNESTNSNIAVFRIPNLANNEKIVVLELLQNNQPIETFRNKNFEIRNKNINYESDAFSYQSDVNWELWNASSTQYSFAMKIQRLKGNAEWPDAFALKILNQNFEEQFIDLSYDNRSEREPRGVNGYIAKNNIKQVLGLAFRNAKTYYDITNFSSQIKIPNQSNTLSFNSNFNINSILVENNEVKVKYSNNIDQSIDSIKLLVKSLNPLEPWSKIINTSLNKAQKYASFSLQELPKNINNFIIVGANLANENIHYGLNDLYKFKINNISKQFSVNDFKVIKDENNKSLYGSLQINFESSDFDFFKNKWFQLIFEPEIYEDQKEYYGLNLVKEYKVNVPFEMLWKFGLNGFYENTKYTLKSIKAINPYLQDDYYDQFNLSDNLNKSFVYKYNYNVVINQKIANDTSLPNLVDVDLITQRKNLTRQDLINIWLSSETRTKIPYSIQNHFALVEYERYHFYKKNTGEIKARKRFVLINENNEEVNIRIIAPREIINNSVINISNNNKHAFIQKDLEEYTNLDAITDDAFFIFNLELDNKKRKLSELTEIDPASSTSKSFVYIAINYKDLKTNQIIDNLPFSFLQTRGSLKTQETLYKEMQDRFKFKATLTNNKLKLEIIPKYDNVVLVDSLADHYFSLLNSTFIGNITTSLHWANKNNEIIDVSYQGKPLENNLSVSLNELFIDNTNKDNEHLFEKNIKVKNKTESTKRLYQEDNSSSTQNIRSRSFSFSNGPHGTWSVLGKVKPEDDSDHNYYVISNQHVWVDMARSSGLSEDGNEFKILSTTNLKIPLMLNRPENINEPDKRGLFYNSDTWNLNGIDFRIEAITNFNDDDKFPNPMLFKDTYGDSIVSNGRDKYILGRADLVVAKVDMSFFFNNFSLETIQTATYNGYPLTDRQKEIVKFFLNWKNLKMMEISPYNNHLSPYYNLNWFLAPYPGARSINKDSIGGQRYREYLLGNSNDLFDVVRYLGSTVRNTAVNFETSLIDIAAGSSGTSVYDANNRLVGLVVQSDRGTDTSVRALGGMFVVDGQKYKFIGDGNTPQNPVSFYERVRLLAYLYPHKYKNNFFNKKPKTFFK